MIHYRNVDNWKLINYQGHSIKEVHTSLGKVWPLSLKIRASYNDGTTYLLECDNNPTLTHLNTHPNKYVFSGMTSAEIGDCVTSIARYDFGTCQSLTSVTIGSGVTTIGEAAFFSCQSLTSIDIPDNVTSIGSKCFFMSNAITNVIIGSGVTLISDNAFNNCTSLTSITVNATTPPAIGGSVFYATNDCPIYVPCQSITQYKSAWSTYASRIQCIEPYGERYLTFVAQESGTFSFTPLNSNVIEYSKNGGVWTQGNSVSVASGDTVLWKGEMTPASSSPSFGVGTFSSTCSFKAEGNPMSLFYGDSFKGQTNLSGKRHAFHGLFKNCAKLTSIENLELEATTLEQSCYAEMFQGCTSLSAVSMNLLPATTLTNGCYNNMFYGCSSLTSVVNLQAMTLAKNCYNGMYAECTSLTTVNKLPSTTLAEWCYHYMFEGCTSLTTVPTDMLPATTLANGCYGSMFNGCTELTTAPELLANTLVEYCYNAMFENCSKLNNIKCLATSINGTNTTTNWIKNVASSGTFTKATSMNSWNVCNTAYYNGIPCNWNVQDA